MHNIVFFLEFKDELSKVEVESGTTMLLVTPVLVSTLIMGYLADHHTLLIILDVMIQHNGSLLHLTEVLLKGAT